MSYRRNKRNTATLTHRHTIFFVYAKNKKQNAGKTTFIKFLIVLVASSVLSDESVLVSAGFGLLYFYSARLKFIGMRFLAYFEHTDFE